MYLKKAVVVSQVANVANNGSGLIRVTTSTAHGRTTGDAVHIADVGGVTAANGRWVVTVIDANTIDLQSSTFSGTYTSGGFVALKQQLRLKLTTSPSTPLQVAADVRYLNPLNGVIAGTDTVLTTLPSDAAVTVLESDLVYDMVVDLLSVFNADASTRILEVTRRNQLVTVNQARASLATLERAEVSRSRVTLYSSTGRVIQEAL